MKTLFPILALLVLSACHSSVLKNESVSAKPSPTVNNFNASNSSSTPDDAFKVEQRKQNELETQNEKFKSEPEDFKQIDFKNYSYPYKFSYARKLNFTLKDGENEYDFKDDRGWFSLSDVYYVDLTGDGNPEAIVILWHVSCGVSCDGGAGLFYVYTIKQGKLKSIWQYETGSLAYGCGLKSFIVKNGKITMELFGKCFDEENKPAAVVKFLVKGVSRFTFSFNGRKFVEERKEFIPTSERDVKNFKPEISINE
jgi:hypothetical protein